VDDVIIVGAGIGGLTLALALHRAGIASRVYEEAPEIRPIGVGINLLPHATRELAALGLEAELARVSVATREAVFFNRFGQLIYREPLGRSAGYDWPQFSIHRADLQQVLLAAVRERIGAENVLTGWRYTGCSEDGAGVTARFRAAAAARDLPPQRGAILVGCDGLHSEIRAALHPGASEPRYSGVTMWRGVTRWQPILGGATMIRAGWLATGKLVLYPIRDRIDGAGHQLVNWVAEIETPQRSGNDRDRAGVVEDFIAAFEDWRFEWLDVPRFVRAADAILEFPMVDHDPLPWWSRGRVTLLGDAAHPTVPRGSNGAGQAILDARALADCLAANGDSRSALEAYERRRLGPTADVVRMSRNNPPDAILREVYRRTGDRPFARIEDVISLSELTALSENYKRVAGYDLESLRGEAR
jgi:2-polyprenyl-6-methoxyphenol hydroxylase-like FAD-dependent oxidoreductase